MNILDTLATELTQKLKLRLNRMIEETVSEALGLSQPAAQATPVTSTLRSRKAPRKRTGRADRAERQQDILKLVQSTPKSISEIATALGKRAAGVGSTVHHMKRAGLVVKKGDKFQAKAAKAA